MIDPCPVITACFAENALDTVIRLTLSFDILSSYHEYLEGLKKKTTFLPLTD